MSLKNLTSSFWAILSVVILNFISISCTDTETTDSTNFVIYYTGLTDIGPSMTGEISSPSYKGPAPSDFSITEITLNGEPYSGQCFNIDATTGSISVSNTKNAAIGTYKISISCIANGQQYNFKDIVVVNMLKAIPEGVKVEPDKLEIKLQYIRDNQDQLELPTAQVISDGSHVSISQYSISSVFKDGILYENFNKLFTISQTGIISTVPNYAEAEPGIYVLNLKLRTNAMGNDSKEEDGLFTNALTVDITSEPMDLIYTPEEDFIEQASSEHPDTKYDTQNAPTMIGSKDGLAFSIESVMPKMDNNGTPTIDKFTIDGEGKIHVAAGHGFTKGEIFFISIRVKNKYAPEGIVFENKLKLETVDFITPIANFTYGENHIVQQVEKSKFTIQKNQDFEGDKVSFILIEEGLDPKIVEQLKPGFNAEDGSFTINKGNKLPIGNYTIRVQAKNQKSTEENPTIAEFSLQIGKNPNNFTTFSYGNNYKKYYSDKDFSDEIFDNQFRYRTSEDIQEITPIASSFDFDKTVRPGYTPTITWEAQKVRKVGFTKIEATTGKFKFNWPSGNDDMSFADAAIITATAYDGEKYSKAEDDPTAVSVTLPVFVHMSMVGGTVSAPKDNYRIEYTPFVLKVSPRNGGTSEQVNIYETQNGQTNPVNWIIDNKHFALDYARTFYYHNIGGIRTEIDGETPPDNSVHETGVGDKGANDFLCHVWKRYDDAISSYGAKDPVSGFDKDGNPITDLNKPLAYVNNGDSNPFTVKVVANKWYDHGYANGLFIAQMTYITKTNGNMTTEDTKKIKDSGIKAFPFVIWFDEKFGE